MAMYLANTVKSFAGVNLDFGNRDATFPELANLPDGAYKIRHANKNKLSYNLQLNDLKYWQYHRNNGITKIGVFDKESNVTYSNLRSIEGALTIADVIN